LTQRLIRYSYTYLPSVIKVKNATCCELETDHHLTLSNIINREQKGTKTMTKKPHSLAFTCYYNCGTEASVWLSYMQRERGRMNIVTKKLYPFPSSIHKKTERSDSRIYGYKSWSLTQFPMELHFNDASIYRIYQKICLYLDLFLSGKHEPLLTDVSQFNENYFQTRPPIFISISGAVNIILHNTSITYVTCDPFDCVWENVLRNKIENS